MVARPEESRDKSVWRRMRMGWSHRKGDSERGDVGRETQQRRRRGTRSGQEREGEGKERGVAHTQETQTRWHTDTHVHTHTINLSTDKHTHTPHTSTHIHADVASHDNAPLCVMVLQCSCVFLAVLSLYFFRIKPPFSLLAWLVHECIATSCSVL